MAIKDELEIDPTDYDQDSVISSAIAQQLDQLLEHNSQDIFELADKFAREDADFISGALPPSSLYPTNSASKVLH